MCEAALRKFSDCVIFATPSGSIIILLDSGEAMAERDLTVREDRFIGLCLVAAAILVVFIYIRVVFIGMSRRFSPLWRAPA